MNEELLAKERIDSKKIGIIYAQTRVGAASVLVLCALLGFILVRAVGWGAYLSWYLTVAAAAVGRQIYFSFLLKQHGSASKKLDVIASVAALTGSMAVAGLPLFSGSLGLSDIAVMSAIMVGWSAVGVSVLWVRPPIYAVFIIVNNLGIFLAWVGPADLTSLYALAFALVFGSILLINVARLISRQQDELERNSASKTRLLAAANHDLRQPAHALGLFMSLLKESPGDTTLIDGADAAVRALMGMLDAYFDYSRLESRSENIQVSSFRIQQLFDQLMISFFETAEKQGTALIIRPCCASVQSDPVLLQRILLNLISNAIKFTQNGRVLVCCRSIDAGRRLRIDVLDSGIGIDKINHEKIFEEFFQCDNAPRIRDKGVGLGLSLVNEACKLLKHRLALRSCLGHGSRFSVTVPISHLEVATEQAVSDKDLRLENVKNIHVLLVEDDPLGAAALKEQLTFWGYTVHIALDFKGACVLLEYAPKPDLLICDYRLPGGISGVETVQRLRLACGSMVPAFIISGEVDGAAKSHALEAGLTLLQKPVAPAKLRSHLRRIDAASRS